MAKLQLKHIGIAMCLLSAIGMVSSLPAEAKKKAKKVEKKLVITQPKPAWYMGRANVQLVTAKETDKKTKKDKVVKKAYIIHHAGGTTYRPISKYAH